ncbi:hypothetical protein CYY_004463 [Polysphondylium violaceum]|uniref:3-methyl-2-oxobutanoate hydroxymethyltransferase n=1 Tax=Polysphondylium violaceum TaxID=133409 RepID=A0A8J4PWL3_9MYCE|nr:hypothetical protein CYY_004463 [Polysphondylium violaceum]
MFRVLKNIKLPSSSYSTLQQQQNRFNIVCHNNNNKRFYSSQNELKKTSILDIKKKYKEKIPITMSTAYDYCSSKEVDRAGIDTILVGDSLGMVMLGEKGTTGVTMDQMVHHCKAVLKGSSRCFVVGDMPFGSFESSERDAVQSAMRLVKEGGVDAIKLEGGKKHKDKIRAIVDAGIPVMGHIGLTPQSISALGGFKLQGKTSQEAMDILQDALALQQAGCFAIVLEMVPDAVASLITQSINIPTIGIGAGNGTSGQVLVYHDMLGMYSDFKPKFVKQYCNLSDIIHKNLKDFKSEVESKQFPSTNHSFSMKENELIDFINSLKDQKDSFQSKDFKNIIDNNQIILNSSSKKEDSKKENNNINNNMANEKKQDDIKKDSNNSNSTKSNQASLNLLPNKKVPKIVVIGAGAMGSFFSAKLASKQNSEVWMVSAWKEHVEKINKNGLTLFNINGQQENIKSIKATMDGLDVIKDGYPDLALVLVKSHSTRQAALTAAKLIGGNPNASVLTLQNGVGNREEIESTIHEQGLKNRVWQGVTSNGAIVVAPGLVQHTGHGSTFLASPYLQNDDPNSSIEERQAMEIVNGILNESGVNTQLSYNVDGMVWGKVIVNAAINPLSAVLGVPNGYLVSNQYSKNMMKRIIDEGMGVCRAKGIELPFGQDSEDGFKYAQHVANSTFNNYSSMFQDVARGQPTEINSINGVIVKEGEKLDIGVENNKMIMEMVLSCSSKKKDFIK